MRSSSRPSSSSGGRCWPGYASRSNIRRVDATIREVERKDGRLREQRRETSQVCRRIGCPKSRERIQENTWKYNFEQFFNFSLKLFQIQLLNCISSNLVAFLINHEFYYFEFIEVKRVEQKEDDHLTISLWICGFGKKRWTEKNWNRWRLASFDSMQEKLKNYFFFNSQLIAEMSQENSCFERLNWYKSQHLLNLIPC